MGTFLFFLSSFFYFLFFARTKNTKTQISWLQFCGFLCVWCFLVLFVLLWCFLVGPKSFCKKNKWIKGLKLSWWPHLYYYWIHLIAAISFFNYHTLFQVLQFFSIIIIFFNNHSLFQWSWSFSIITIFFNNHNLFIYYNLWYYIYGNNSKYKFYHPTHIFYRQNMTKIFCQFHMFLIYAFYFKFFSFCV